MEFPDAFDIAYNIKCNQQVMSNLKTSVSMKTDSLSLFNLLMKALMTTVMVNLKPSEGHYDNMDLRDVPFIQSQFSISDGLEKCKTERCSVRNVASLSIGLFCSTVDYHEH